MSENSTVIDNTTASENLRVHKDSVVSENLTIPQCIKMILNLRDKQSNIDSNSILDIKNNSRLYKIFLEHDSCSWVSREIKFTNDRNHYINFNADEKKLIKTIVSFFLVGDGPIVSNIIYKFLLEANSITEQAWYISQAQREVVHSLVYSMFLDEIAITHLDRQEILNIANNSEYVNRKLEFMRKYTLEDTTDPSIPYVASCCSEGVFFVSNFPPIYWFGTKGLIPGFVQGNVLISRDENKHREWFGEMANTVRPDDISPWIEIIKEAVEIESLTADEIRDITVGNINRTNTLQFIRFAADVVCKILKIPTIYNVSDPYSWMSAINNSVRIENQQEIKTTSYNTTTLNKVSSGDPYLNPLSIRYN